MINQTPTSACFAHRSTLTLQIVLLAMFQLVATGCHVVQPGQKDVAAASAAPVPVVAIDVMRDGNTPQRKQVPLNGPTTVHQALKQAGLSRKLNNMDIQVVRRVGPNGRLAKMGVEYVPNRRIVAPHTDYALFPGDRIVLTEKSTYPLAELMGPLSSLLSRRR